jgi:hypothetical protein
MSVNRAVQWGMRMIVGDFDDVLSRCQASGLLENFDGGVTAIGALARLRERDGRPAVAIGKETGSPKPSERPSK